MMLFASYYQSINQIDLIFECYFSCTAKPFNSYEITKYEKTFFEE